MLMSTVCRYDDFLTDWYTEWASRLHLSPEGKNAPSGHIVHRKAWEWCVIAQALMERGMLEPGRTGCGFAVGTEPLASAFAARGVQVLATDQAGGENAENWIKSGQHAASLESLYRPDLISRSDFDSRVRFSPVDMRKLELPWEEQFDFIWSSCSIEHLGTLEAGWRFVLDSMDLVKVGGFAIHTTEYNVTSNCATIETGDDVIYRERDVEELDRRLRSIACGLARCDFYAGDHPNDLDYDHWVFFKNRRPHVKLLIHGHVATSMVLIIQKGSRPGVEVESLLAETHSVPPADAANGRFDSVEQHIAQLRSEVAEQSARSARIQARIEEIEKSFAWRVATFLRLAGRGDGGT